MTPNLCRGIILALCSQILRELCCVWNKRKKVKCTKGWFASNWRQAFTVHRSDVAALLIWCFWVRTNTHHKFYSRYEWDTQIVFQRVYYNTWRYSPVCPFLPRRISSIYWDSLKTLRVFCTDTIAGTQR